MEKFIQAILSLLGSLLGSLATIAPKVETSAPEGPPRGVQDVSLIKEFEGLELEAYLCPAKVWTIGYGHTKTAKPGMKITPAGAEHLLRLDLEWVESTINKNVKVELTQNQYDALASFIYNIGGGAFKKSTLLRKLNAGDFEGASAEFPRWNKAGGKVLKGLTRRREAERKLFDKNG